MKVIRYVKKPSGRYAKEQFKDGKWIFLRVATKKEHDRYYSPSLFKGSRDCHTGI